MRLFRSEFNQQSRTLSRQPPFARYFKTAVRMTCARISISPSAIGVCTASACAVPFLAIRAILDPVEEDLKIAFDRFLDEHGEPRPLPLIRYLIAQPQALLRLVALGLRTKTVCGRLGHVLRELSSLPL